MKKNFKVSELCEKLNVCSQYFYKIIKKPIIGQIYDENQINYNELKKFINNKFANNIDELLNDLDIESLDDIVIIKNNKSISNINEISIDELEINNKYIIRSYHYTKNYILRNIINNDDEVLYIFENLEDSNSKKDKYRCLTNNELLEDRFRIELLEE